MKIDVLRAGIEQKFYELCTGVVTDLGYKLYDLEYIKGSSVLRLYIYSEETKTALIEDCVAVDRAMTEHVENSDWMPESLVLEVSSPGIYRSLKTTEQFEDAIGSDVSASITLKITKEDFEGAPKDLLGNRKFIATLVGLEPSSVKLNFEGYEFALNLSDIKKINMETKI